MNKDLILREKLALQRTVLANQSTFLAFLRTSMYFLVAGLTINNLLQVEYGSIIRSVMFVIAGLLFLTGIINYFYQHRSIRSSEQHIGNYKLDYEDDDL
jgi:putative membrane protein